MKTVGVLSDTHGKLSMDATGSLMGCDFIIHAGDIGGPSILSELAEIAPVIAVLGNNDYSEYGSAVSKFARPVIEGVRFLVSHYPRDVLISFAGRAGIEPGDPIPQICIHGHTHMPKLETGAKARPAQLILCPGSVSRPRSGNPASIAIIQVEAGRILHAHIESLRDEVLMNWDA